MHALAFVIAVIAFLYWASNHKAQAALLVVGVSLGLYGFLTAEQDRRIAKQRAEMGPARIIQKDSDGYIEITADGVCMTFTFHGMKNGDPLQVPCYRPERYAKWPAIVEAGQPKFKVLESPVVIQRQPNVRKVY